jgi:hypothetical protein
MIAISKNNMHHTFISADCRIDADICKGSELTMYRKLRACHIKGTNRRMMADLLIVNRDSFEIGCEGLTDNGIEWLLHQ